MSTIVEQVFTNGLEGACLILLLVLAYKIYKVKIKTKSNCCDGFYVETENTGGDREFEFTESKV